MAPKRKAKVVTTTKKVVQETVEVTLVDKDQKLAAEAGNGVEILQQESDSKVVKTTVAVEGKLAEGAEQVTVEIPVQQPPQKETATTTEAPRTPTKPEAKDKTQGQKKTQEAKKKGRREQEDDDETQSPEDNPRAEAEGETETLEEEPALDGAREKAQETGKERPSQKTEKERAREADEKARGGRPRRRRRRRVGEGGGEEQYKRYVFRVLKQVHPELRISSAAMEVLNGYMNDMFERLAAEAARLSSYAGIKTLSSRDIQGAVRLVLPGELGRHAIAEGAKALSNYMEHDGGGGGGAAAAAAKFKP
ncbi:hypothetical protein BT93_J0519 [Corymbia citriodora subsp. variegata]|nr:hypothetical protein BT93_J0519 [Corymbia citriodora subsp. variegata]